MIRSGPVASREAFPETLRLGRSDLLLLLILALAAFLRSINLGTLGYRGDEDLTWLAVHGIQEHGVPLLPSGVGYERGFPYSYLAAASAALFGHAMMGLRLPSLLCSLGTILFVYLLVRDMAGRVAGFLAALLLAVSPWEHHYARTARMYAPFVMLVSATLFFSLRSLVTESRSAWLSACALALVAVPMHELGATMILIFLVPALFPDQRPPLRWIAGGVVAVVIGMSLEPLFAALPPMRDRAGLQIVLDVGTHAARISLPLLPEVTLNYARWIPFDLWQESPLAASVAILGLAAAALGTREFLRRTAPSRPPFDRFVLRALGLLYFLLLVFHQLVLAAFVGLAMLVSLGRAALPVRRSIVWLGSIATTVVLSLILAQAIAQGPGGAVDRSFLRLFFAIPVPFYRLMLQQHPISVLIILLGACLLFPRFLRGSADPLRGDAGQLRGDADPQRGDAGPLRGDADPLRGGADPRPMTLLGFLLSSLLLMGLFSSPYVLHRYTYYLNPALVALVVICAKELGLAAAARWPKPSHRRTVALGIWIVLVLVSDQFDPMQTWAAAHRGYGSGREVLTDPDLLTHYLADYESCARFVLEDRRQGDIAIAKVSEELYPFGLHCDFELNEIYGVYGVDPAGRQFDWYIGVPILSSRSALESVVDKAHEAGRTVYIIYTRLAPGGPAVHLPEDVFEFLRAHEREIVHTGRDGLTVVVRLRPS